ncbi:glycosyltransferase family 4 protein [Deferribacter abyssi]|uniref:glycosyltransferase family 4 protein n=1 Tax=Deferribacter abyssi TaxID=213806 RepID=UPI003C256912
MQYKILHIIPYITSKYGGPPYVVKSLNKFFNKNNFNSQILTLCNKNKNDNNIKCFKLTTKYFWFSFDFMFNSIKYIKNCDIIFIHGIYSFTSLWGSIIGKIFNKKILLLPHGMLDKDSINSSNIFKNIIRKIFLYTIGLIIIKFANKIIFNSQKEKENSIFSKNSIVIPNGVDVEYIGSIKCNKKYFAYNKISLFFLGRIHPIKGIELLVDAINILDDNMKNKIEVVIAGNGDMQYIKYLQKKSDKCIKFIGHIEGDEKYCYLKQCDIYLQPSQTEGLSISMLEAMACKVNMITTNKVGLYEELVKNNAAKIINYDVKELKEAIFDIITNRLDFKEKGFELIKEKYNWNMIVKEYKKLI